MKTRYVGITLGPLNDTLALAGSAAGLWAASYLFSYLADTLCRLLVEAGVAPEDFVVPYYDPADELMQAHREAGMYHDRIIFRAPTLSMEAVGQVRQRAIADTAAAYSLDADYLSRYLLVGTAAFEADNPVAESEPILNSLELAPPFVAAQTGNPIITLLQTNRALRSTRVMRQVGNRLLTRPEGGYKDIPGMVATGAVPPRYYAMVRADGDGIGRLVRSLRSDGEIRAFSRACLAYCARVAALTREHDGFTVYAGGDDLLAMLPCVDSHGRALPVYLEAAARLYKESFASYGVETTLSFGVVPTRVNTPLHETLADTAYLLFDRAKSLRDTVAVRLEDRHNVADGLLIGSAAMPTVLSLLEQRIPRNHLLTVQKCLQRYGAVFAAAQGEQELRYLLCSYLEKSGPNAALLQDTMPRLLAALQRETLPLYAIKGEGRGTALETACCLLELLTFFAEREVKP